MLYIYYQSFLTLHALKIGLENEGYNVDIQFANNNVATQINQLENMVFKNYKAVVVCTIESTSLNSALEQAKAKGITIIAYNRLLMNTNNGDYYVTFSNFDVGVAQGKYIEEKLALKTAARPF